LQYRNENTDGGRLGHPADEAAKLLGEAPVENQGESISDAAE